MQFVFTYPVYAFVQSAATNANGEISFTNPLTITCNDNANKSQSIVAIPIFTDEAKAAAFRQATQAPHSRLLKMPAHENFVDFLHRASGVADYLAMDPTPPTLTSDRVWSIAGMIDALQQLMQK